MKLRGTNTQVKQSREGSGDPSYTLLLSRHTRLRLQGRTDEPPPRPVSVSRLACVREPPDRIGRTAFSGVRSLWSTSAR
jgi:hypothetical protein